MSLTWQVNRIPNYKTLCWDEDGNMNPVTNSLIWHTMTVGMGNTAQDPDEFVWRVLFYERLHGASVWDENGPHYLTATEVRSHVGLTTNAGDETHTAFVKRIAKQHREDTLRGEKK